MTQQQWDKHLQHMEEHIKWPATKDEILDACEGQDVEDAVLQDINEHMPEGNKKYTKEEVYEMLVSE